MKPLAPVADSALVQDAMDIPVPESHLRFPWRDLDAVYGPMLPGSLHILSARTGSGKTLFVTNWLWATMASGVPVAYFPLETPGKEVVQRLACYALGANPSDVLRGDFSGVDGGWRRFADEVIAVNNRFLRNPRLLWLYDTPRVSIPALTVALTEAAKNGVRVAVVDHLLRLELNESDMYGSVSNAVRSLKMLADETGMVIVVTSQQSRGSAGGDKLAWYAPPDLSALKGAGTLEEEADGVLFLHRILRDDLTTADMADVRAGRTPMQEAIAKNVMGCAIGKHRLDGGQTGAQVRLWVDRGVVTDLPDEVKRTMAAQRHAIRTNADYAR